MESFDTSLVAFSQWLLRATLQGSLLVCLILLVKAALRERLPARWHYCLWLLLLVRLALPWAPQSRLSIYNLVPRSLPSYRALSTPAGGARLDGTYGQPRAAGQEGGAGPASVSAREERSQPGQAGGVVAPSLVASSSRGAAGADHLPFFEFVTGAAPWLWLAGCLALGGYILLRAFILWRAVRSERPVTDQQILDLLEDCKLQMRVRTLVGVVVTDRTRSPALFGFVRPRVLLPEGLTEALGLDELHYVFLHELAHLKRRDIYLAWLVCLVQVLHWFNPLMWYAFRRMRTDQEMAADALALSAAGTDESRHYGRTIVNLLERFSRPHYVPSIAGILEEPGNIERRITMIAKFKRDSHRWSPLAAALIVVLCCISLPDAQRMKASERSAATAALEPTLRRIEVRGPATLHSQPSFDGKYMSDVDRNTGGLIIREVASGKERMLPTNSDPNRFVYESRISPDNKKVVFLQFNPLVKDFDLRVVGFDGSGLRTLLRSDQIGGYFHMDAWSPDAKHILGRLERKPEQLARLRIEDGVLEVVETFEQEAVSKVAVSPDGRYVVYSRADPQTSSPNIFVFDLERREESRVVTSASSDELLGWTPDGQFIFFASDRDGTRDGWVLHVVDGKPQGLPELVKPGLGEVAPIGFTQTGAFYYAFGHEGWNVYTVTLDLGAGQVASEPNPVRVVGKDGCPDWSPDGRYLAYCSQPDSDKPQIIRIRTLATGEERELRPDLPHFDWLRWCPDSRSLLVTDFEDRSAVCRLDVQTGGHTTLVQSDKQRIRGAELSADGKTLAYRIRGSGNSNWLYVRDLETGREKEILQSGTTASLTLSPFTAGWALSPDGKQIALSVREGETDKPLRPLVLKIVSIANGQAKTIAEPPISEMAWTSDGHELLFVRHGNELWRVSAEGGQPQKLWEWERKQPLWGPRIDPGARHLAFCSGGYVSEMWLMENFLPTRAAAKSEPVTTVRRIGGDWGTFASLSPDGKYLCDVDWETEALAVLELATGKIRHVTSKSPDDACYPLDSAISPDSRQVAYLWWDPNARASSLHAIGLDGSGHRLLREGGYPMPRAWSADGRKILAVVGENDVQKVVWVSASEGPMQEITSFDSEGLGYPGKFDISPGGRFIAYDRPQTEHTSHRDIFVFDMIDRAELPVIQHPSNDKLLGWTPDGRYLLFASYRTGTWDAWLQMVTDGQPRGFPKLVKPDIGDVRPIGFAPDGSYYYAHERGLQDVFTARFDLETGAVLSEPVPVRQTGATTRCDWSPDGQYLAYCERRPDKSHVIYIRTLSTGRERMLADSLPDIRWLRWSLDGRSVLIDGARRADSQGVIFRIDAQTGERSDLVRSETEVLLRPEMSPDGKTLFFERVDPKSGTMRLMARDLESGRERELFRTESPAQISGADLSPDGRRFVLSVLPSRTRSQGPVLKILSTAGGQPRELIRFDASERLRAVGVTWMPDSHNVVFRKWFQGDRELELWRVSAEGGTPEKLWMPRDRGIGPGYMRIHPDGQRVAFEGRSTTRGIWVMENFLLKALAAARE